MESTLGLTDYIRRLGSPLWQRYTHYYFLFAVWHLYYFLAQYCYQISQAILCYTNQLCTCLHGIMSQPNGIVVTPASLRHSHTAMVLKKIKCDWQSLYYYYRKEKSTMPALQYCQRSCWQFLNTLFQDRGAGVNFCIQLKMSICSSDLHVFFTSLQYVLY